MNYCSACQQDKPQEDFCKDSRGRDGLSYACRTCSSDRARRYRDKRVALMRRHKERPCSDCEETWPAPAMHFDHVPNRGEKRAAVAALAKVGDIDIMLSEMDKCDVVCANCHAIRTKERGYAGGHFRSEMWEEPVGVRYNRSLSSAVVSFVKRRACAKCERPFSLCCMQLDHLPKFTKKKSIAELVYKGYHLSHVVGELVKCQVLCTCCHAIVTAERKRKDGVGVFSPVSAFQVQMAVESLGLDMISSLFET